ncbi:MAG: glycosyltransferase, partial [Proteobacteria bacterium]|nr:glycosyltransferase [Pseudomonadota bacterium]
MNPKVQPFFSIVTAVYNAEKVIEETAASLRDQDFGDFEWIVVDGGSTDRTLEVIRPYVVEGRDTIISEPDRGVYDAMNKGLRRARGKVVQFQNAGDRFADAAVLGAVAAEFDDEVEAVYGDAIYELANGLTIFKPGLDIAIDQYRSIPFCHQSLYTRRETHLRHPFDLTYRIAADYAMIAAMHQAGVRMKRLKRTLNVDTIEPT